MSKEKKPAEYDTEMGGSQPGMKYKIPDHMDIKIEYGKPRKKD